MHCRKRTHKNVILQSLAGRLNALGLVGSGVVIGILGCIGLEILVEVEMAVDGWSY